MIARRVNAWRDIFPPTMASQLEGKGEGESIEAHYAPGELVPPHNESLVRKMEKRQFRSVSFNGNRVRPQVGRFYPQGLFNGLAGVYPGTITPSRIIAMDDASMTLDCNHPLAGVPLTIEATIQTVQEKISETGGQLSHWAEELCDNGPGMQARLGSGPVDFTSDGFFDRKDGDDASFYADPRIIGHVDAQASENIAAIYSRFLKPGMQVLDLMSSVQSHLPAGMDLRITGLGMNGEEMAQNEALTDSVVHDLNDSPELPLQGPYDAVLVSLSIEYLTDPLTVLRNARELLAPGGVLLISTSNRWFPTKVTQGWTQLHEFERVGYLLQLAEAAGFSGPMGAESIRNDWRPQSDAHFMETRGVSDPVYVVHAVK